MIGEVAQSTRGVHHYARGGLHKSGKIITGVRYGAKLLLIKGGCYVTVFCLQQRRSFAGDRYSRGSGADCELDISGGDLSESDVQCPSRFLETGGRHGEGISARSQELEMVDAVLVGLRD